MVLLRPDFTYVGVYVEAEDLAVELFIPVADGGVRLGDLGSSPRNCVRTQSRMQVSKNRLHTPWPAFALGSLNGIGWVQVARTRHQAERDDVEGKASGRDRERHRMPSRPRVYCGSS